MSFGDVRGLWGHAIWSEFLEVQALNEICVGRNGEVSDARLV